MDMHRRIKIALVGRRRTSVDRSVVLSPSVVAGSLTALQRKHQSKIAVGHGADGMFYYVAWREAGDGDGYNMTRTVVLPPGHPGRHERCPLRFVSFCNGNEGQRTVHGLQVADRHPLTPFAQKRKPPTKAHKLPTPDVPLFAVEAKAQQAGSAPLILYASYCTMQEDERLRSELRKVG